MSEIEIKFLADVPEHVEETTRWRYAEWGHLFPELTLDDFIAKTREHLNRDKLPLFLIALEKGKPIGVIALRDCDMKGREELRPWIGGFYVEESRRGQGIGKILLKKVLQVNRQMGFSCLYLYTYPPTENYYLKQGWETIEKTVYTGVDVVIMRIKLGGSGFEPLKA